VFEVIGKHITERGLDPKASAPHHEVYDVPWSLTLASGNRLHAAYWHNRFGIEHTDGALHVSPRDGARLFGWVTPELPEAWHGVSQAEGGKTKIRIRK
jgi:hypothetical protein